MLKKSFHFQIEKLRDEDKSEKQFNYVFLCTNKSVGEWQDQERPGNSNETVLKRRKQFKSKG